MNATIECGYCGEPYHGRCTSCHRPGVPYEYHGQAFDGLCAYHGDRLCPVCRDARMNTEGVNILVVDGRPSIPPYVYNTVRDRDTVHIWIPPQTFLAYTLHGKAKDYSAGYHDALMRALSRRLAAGTVTEIRSKGGSTTYIRTEDAARANRAHVRALLAEQQPGYAAALEIMVRTVVV